MKSIHLIFLYLLVVCSSCEQENVDLKLRVNNTSNSPIFTAWTTDYPDTSFSHVLNPTLNPRFYKVEANSVQKNHYNSPTKSLFNDKIDTLTVFIFDAQELEATPWDTVKANYLVLRRYDLSLEDLESTNWIITYP